MTMNVRPSRVSSVSGVCTLSSTLTGEDENSISERSRRGRFDGIHQARASSASVNSVSSSVMANSPRDRKSTRLNSSHVSISYAVFCLKKKKNNDAESEQSGALVAGLGVCGDLETLVYVVAKLQRLPGILAAVCSLPAVLLAPVVGRPA